MNKYWTKGAIVTFVIIIFLYSLYYAGLVRFNYPDHTVKGIDVSHVQGKIDWKSVVNDKVKFAFLKATEGGNFKDKRFSVNWKHARLAGIRVGAYHFFTLCRKGEDQAKNFIQSVPSVKDSLPPVIDLEFVGNCSKRPTKAEFLNELNKFVQQLVSHYKRKPIIYTTYGFFNAYLVRSKYSKFDIWIRDVFKNPSKAKLGGRDWMFWQYADHGRISGIKGPVDLNVFYGTIDRLDALASVI